MMELLYAAAGALAGGVVVELVKRQGRRELDDAKRELLAKLEAMQGVVRGVAQQTATTSRAAIHARPRHGDEVDGMCRESLEGVQQLLQDAQAIIKTQTSVGHKLGELQVALHALARPEPRSNQAQTRAPSTSFHEAPPVPAARPALPPEDRAAAPELSARMTLLWNELPWPSQSDEGIRRLGLELGMQIAGPFKHRYWLLHGGGNEPFFLLPALGKDVSLFADGFFELPAAGNANQLRRPAQVQLRPGAQLQDELARLRDPDSGITLQQVFPEFRGGHVE